MNFFGLILPFIVSIGQQMSKVGSLGYDTVTKRLIYRESEGANGIKTLATIQDLEDLQASTNSPYFVGQIVQSITSQVPNGFVPLNGGTLSKLAYAALYAVIGDVHNDANTPNGHFKLPDARNRVLVYDPNILGQMVDTKIAVNNIPKMTPKLMVFDGVADVLSPAYPAITNEAGLGTLSSYKNEQNAQIDIITPIGVDEPLPYMPPHLAVNTYIYTGVLF